MSMTVNIHQVIIKVGDVTISDKPLASIWPQQTLRTLAHQVVYIGDFKSHYPATSDQNGENLVEWTEQNNIFVVF